ncbi:SDR family oxidoreductase [Variovorax sp. J22R24]|uniref:SDR family NAD(P)-dependent oxidoreductase n=1 Tax=Variovorax gracilis TaxID=3053502 RepID=UPI0025784284|nr:SDR family oxidoreductase [Variovorax sp. J22R24]MDM0106581.1 SDR family oxidoreductase [Variovorax sp. J22R24]
MGKLEGKTAIVTGSGQNIGAAIAKMFAREGANVVVNGSSNKESVNATVEAIKQGGGRAMGVMADVGDPEQIEAMVRQAEEMFGAVDITVSNVGRRLKLKFEDISVSDWQNTINSNLSSCFYMARSATPGMRERRWGRLIHISGYDGFTGHTGERAANVTAKAGMHGLTKALARELGVHNITCNTVVPGYINTVRDMTQYSHFDLEKVVASIPLGHSGHVDDIAKACLFLASEGGDFISGQALHVNGGEFMF